MSQKAVDIAMRAKSAQEIEEAIELGLSAARIAPWHTPYLKNLVTIYEKAWYISGSPNELIEITDNYCFYVEKVLAEAEEQEDIEWAKNILNKHSFCDEHRASQRNDRRLGN